LAHFYPDEYSKAAEQKTLGDFDLNKEELEAMVMKASQKDLGILTVDDLHGLVNYPKRVKLMIIPNV